MKKIWLICLLLLSVNCVAIAKQIAVVGYGTTVTEAENDALRNAVENVMGTLIDSQTLAEKNMVLEDHIYSYSKGFVQNYSVKEKHQETDGLWKISIEAEVDIKPNSKLMEALTRKGIIVNNLRNAKIAVIIPEQHLRYRIPDPAGETAVIKKFKEEGFGNIIDVSEKRISYNQPFNLNDEQIKNLAESMEADILVVGEAFSERAGDIGEYLTRRNQHQRTNIISCLARVEARMYIARTGQIIAADGTYGSALSVTETIASKKALANAGEKMGDYLVEQLLNMGSSNKQLLEIVVMAKDQDVINNIKKSLSNIQGVKSVNFNKYINGRGVISVQYSGAPQSLFNKLQAEVDFNIELCEVTYNTLTVKVR